MEGRVGRSGMLEGRGAVEEVARSEEGGAEEVSVVYNECFTLIFVVT